MLIDFTNCKIDKTKLYNGANGKKIAVWYNNQSYMLKFQSPNKSPLTNKSFAESTVSEYISCHIISTLGLPVQETMLGTYTQNDKTHNVVACKDFTSPSCIFRDFASLKNATIESSTSGYDTEIEEVLQVIDTQQYIDKSKLETRFWKQFIADTLIGNFDRHNGNWGFLINLETEDFSLAPIFDCGSSLLPQASDRLFEVFLKDEDTMNQRIYEFPTSALKCDGTKINMYKFNLHPYCESHRQAILTIVDRIELDVINDIIDNTPTISDVRKEFYKTYLKERYQKILLPAWQNAKRG